MALPERRSVLAPDSFAPPRDFEQAAERMWRLLEESLGPLPSREGDDGAPRLPLADIEETDDAYVVEAELPGAGRLPD